MSTSTLRFSTRTGEVSAGAHAANLRRMARAAVVAIGRLPYDELVSFGGFLAEPEDYPYNVDEYLVDDDEYHIVDDEPDRCEMDHRSGGVCLTALWRGHGRQRCPNEAKHDA